MDPSTGAPVSGGTGVPTGTNPGSAGDTGTFDPRDLDRRMAEMRDHVDQATRGFQSVVDRRFAPVGQLQATVGQLQQMVAAQNAQLAQISGYFQQAEESGLTAEEKAARSAQRQSVNYAAQAQQNAMTARIYARLSDVTNHIVPLGFSVNPPDPRLDWTAGGVERNQDPDSWALGMISQANNVWRAEDAARQTKEREQSQSQVSARQDEIFRREQTIAQNQSNAQRAATTEVSTPGGPQADWQEKLNRLPLARRNQVMTQLKDDIVSGRISQPSQFRIPDR